MARKRGPALPASSANQSSVNQRDNERHDRAWRAVQKFNKMVPTLTSFARAITGDNSMTVRAAKQGTSNTDGRNIAISPPIALGDDKKHDTYLCEKRDPESKMKLCDACAAHELLMRRLFHEMAHTVFDSMARPKPYQVKRMRALADEWHPADACNHGSLMKFVMGKAPNLLSLVDAFSPYLLGIMRSYDDARVDSKMYRARPGLKLPTEAAFIQTFTKGVEGLDGRNTLWRDTVLNAQIIVGLLLLGSGHPIRPEYLSDEARNHLADPELVRISDQMLFANTVHNTFDATIEAFLRLQEMGLCVVPKCVPIPPLNQEPDDKPDEDDGDGDGGKDSGKEDPDSGDTDQSDSSGDGSKQSGQDQSDAGESKEEKPDESGAGDDDFENEDSRGDGDDQKGSSPDDQPEEADIPPDDEGDESDQQADGKGDDDPGDGDDDSSTGSPAEQATGDDAEEPDQESEGDPESLPSDTEDQEPGNGDDDGSGGADRGADGEPGADDQGTGDRESDCSGDDGPDDPETDPEEGQVQDTGDADPDVEDADGDLGDAEASSTSRSLKGEDVWNDDNPELDGVGEGDDESPAPESLGTPEEVSDFLEKFLGHGHDEEIDAELLGEEMPAAYEQSLEETAVSTALGQAQNFDCASRKVRGLEIIQYPHHPMDWPNKRIYGDDRVKPADFMPAEVILGKNLLKARLVFAANKRAKNIHNLKSGRVNTKVLGRRAALGDDRLFKKKMLPGKRDYFVVIGVDCSGSTDSYGRNERIKRAVFAKAELLNRLGVPFAIYGHTGGRDKDNLYNWGDDGMTEVWILQVKGPNEAWNTETKQRLADLPPIAENLDGHTLEFYRKVAEKRTETDRIIIYYTDGAMPAANKVEERAILIDQIGICKRKNITLMAVGINTNSPERYGFDTVQVDSDEDLAKVVAHLEKRLVE